MLNINLCAQSNKNSINYALLLTLTFFKFIKNEPKQPSSLTLRRPDIDILNIVMTWLILVFHATMVYCPVLSYRVKDPNALNTAGTESASFYYLVFYHFMNAWNMPLFFFIAGVTSYLSLFRYLAYKVFCFLISFMYKTRSNDSLFFIDMTHFL